MNNDKLSITRRSVLRSSALGVGAMAFGLPAVSGTAFGNHVAGHPSSDFYLYGIDHKSSPNKLVKFHSLDLVPSAGPITVDSIDLSASVNVNTLAAHPYEDGGVRWFYSTDLYSNKAFRINPATGAVEFIGSSNAVLGGIAGSAIVVDASDTARWYGITHGAASPSSTLFEIDLTDGSTTEKGGLHVVDGEESIPIVATHLGMGVNFLTDELWGVIGDPYDNSNSRVFRVVDVETGEIEIPDDQAMTGGPSVGAALGPCASVMYAVRNGNRLFGYDVSSNDEYTYGSLAYDSGSLDFDSLAVPYGFECQQCDPCELDGSYKFEFVYDEEDDLNGFYLEDGDGFTGITYDSELGYVSKDGESHEPITVSFDTDICADQLTAWVKAGKTTDYADITDTDTGISVTIDFDESPFINEKNGKLYAISYVEFECAE